MGTIKSLEQLKETGKPKVLTAPKYKVIRPGQDKSASTIKLMLYGAWGTGKTYAIVDLLQMGYRVLLITTDIGGSGLSTVVMALRKAGREDLLNNIVEVILSNDREFQAFLKNPVVVLPTIYEEDFDILFWDGFANWQQVELSEKIGGLPVERDGSKEVPAHIDSGLMFEQAQWGMVRNGTVRAIHNFCSLHNVKTGKIWHKIVTAQEGVKSKGTKEGGFVETHMPLLQGAGGQLIGAAFDLIIRTKVTKVEEKGKVVKKYIYQIEAENAMSKSRGFTLPDVTEGNMGKLWGELEGQLGIQKGAVDENLKEVESESESN